MYVAYEQTLFSVNRQTQRVEQLGLDGLARSLTPTIDGVIVVVETGSGGRVEYFSAG